MTFIVCFLYGCIAALVGIGTYAYYCKIYSKTGPYVRTFGQWLESNYLETIVFTALFGPFAVPLFLLVNIFQYIATKIRNHYDV